MYPNLKAEMARKNLTQKDIAKCLKRAEPTVNKKINGAATLTLKEISLIRQTFFPNLSLDYLFETGAKK